MSTIINIKWSDLQPPPPSGWDLSPWDEIGRNDNPDRVVMRFAPDAVWFWLAYYRVRRWIKQGLAR